LDFNKKYNTSIVVNSSIKDIGKKVNYLLDNKNYYKLKINKNKKAFKKEFNFEKQINKIKKFIM
jgi:spore maturation protein CgeB